MKVQSKIKRQSNLSWLPEFMFLGLLLFLVGFVVTCKDKDDTGNGDGDGTCVTHRVTLRGIAFNPGALTISACDTVTWEHDDAGIQHTVTSGNVGAGDAGTIFDSSGGDISNTLSQGDTFSHIFNNPGTVPYHCRIHGAGMTGTVTVNP